MQAPRALWHTSRETSAILPASAELDRPSLVEVVSKYSLISTGTERLIAMGDIPAALFDAMAVPYMEGRFEFPVKYGYSVTGIYNERPVHFMHPHQDRCAVSEADFHLIPRHIPLKRATLYSNLETAVNAIWDAQLSDGGHVAVIGFGIVGALTAFAAKSLKGCDVSVYELSASRKDLARELGYKIGDASKPAVAFHTSGTAAGLQAGIDMIGFEGRVIEMSWYGTRLVNLSLGGSFHTDRKSIIASQVGSISQHIKSENKYELRHNTVLRLLEDEVLDNYITHTISLEEAPTLFENIRKGAIPGLGYCIEYDLK